MLRRELTVEERCGCRCSSKGGACSPEQLQALVVFQQIDWKIFTFWVKRPDVKRLLLLYAGSYRIIQRFERIGDLLLQRGFRGRQIRCCLPKSRPGLPIAIDAQEQGGIGKIKFQAIQQKLQNTIVTHPQVRQYESNLPAFGLVQLAVELQKRL